MVTDIFPVGMNIYPFYENTIAWLKEKGYYRDFQLNMEDVEHIQVMNNNTNVYNELVEKQAMEAGASGVGGIIPVRAEDYYRYNSTAI